MFPILLRYKDFRALRILRETLQNFYATEPLQGQPSDSSRQIRWFMPFMSGPIL